jgi:predicted aspartyl protease
VPILSSQLQAQAQQPDGTLVQVPSVHLMQQRGPVLQVTVGISGLISTTLTQRGLPVPAPIAGWALIDTGASGTCIDDAIAQQLGLPAIDVVQMASASHAITQQNLYPAVLEVQGTPIRIEVPRAMGATLGPQGLIALIGRDLLMQCTLHYNGTIGQFTLSI